MILSLLPLLVNSRSSFSNILIPDHFIKETSRYILSDDKISFFISLSSDTPALLPVKSSL